jgi:demethylmenaquinone methyltransferase/2-methoxy-6-polyprenyl-1,4-benzoquinol methylase
MNERTNEDRRQFVRSTFARIADRYDLLNRLMTFGVDLRWRRDALGSAQLPSGAQILDLGAGTGDLSREAERQFPQSTIVAADLTPRMIAVGRAKTKSARVHWVTCDAAELPFEEASFDLVASAFLLRNLEEVDTALQEQRRVLQPSGSLISIETTPPLPGLLRPLVQFHFRVVIPLLASVFSSDSQAYAYLVHSTHGFLEPDALAERMRRLGFSQVRYKRRMFGAVAIHWAVKERDSR